jgi:hypothetical protein
VIRNAGRLKLQMSVTIRPGTVWEFKVVPAASAVWIGRNTDLSTSESEQTS